MQSFFRLISSLFLGSVVCVIATAYEFIFLGGKTYQSEFILSVIIAGSLGIVMMTVGIMTPSSIPQNK
jgi:hypothetical protein